SGAEMMLTSLSLSAPLMRSGAAAVTNSFCLSILPLAASRFVRRVSRSERRASTWLCRDSPIGSFSGPAPRTMPTARARKTETRETRWKRKSITGQSLDEAGGLCRGRGIGPEEGADPAEESVELGADEAEEGLSGRGRGHGHAEGDESGDDEHGQLQAGDALAVEQGDAFGVDELRAHPQSGDEGRGHALAALVEELHDGVVGADGHDELGALVVGEQHGDVLAGAGGGEGHAVDAE